ncbi:hypothetical protein ECDEC12B_3594 [Escherichia coli DEC12B]|nr:hypothetical protein ECDEC12B_3594 [Escherichia coli DEC12B]
MFFVSFIRKLLSVRGDALRRLHITYQPSPKRGTDAIGHNVLAVLPVNEVQQVNLPQRAIVNTQLVVGVLMA